MCFISFKTNLFYISHRQTLCFFFALSHRKKTAHDIVKHRIMSYKTVILKNIADFSSSVFFPVCIVILKCRLTVNIHLTVIITCHSSDNIKKRGLTSTALARYRDELAKIKIKIYLVKCLSNFILRNITLAHTRKTDFSFAHIFSPSLLSDYISDFVYFIQISEYLIHKYIKYFTIFFL